MFIKNILFLAFVMTNSHNLTCSSIASQAQDEARHAKYTFIVMLRNSEKIMSHGHETFNRKTEHQIAEICCPQDPETLNRIKPHLITPDKIKLEDQIPLECIIKPIIPVVVKYLEKGIHNRPNQGFMVTPTKCVIPGIFDLQSVETFRVFTLHDNPVPAHWFM